MSDKLPTPEEVWKEILRGVPAQDAAVHVIAAYAEQVARAQREACAMYICSSCRGGIPFIKARPDEHKDRSGACRGMYVRATPLVTEVKP